MDTINDDRLSVSSRVYQQQGRDRVSLSLLAAFDFAGGKAGEYLPEAELWPLAAPLGKNGLSLEEGFAKPGKEFFVAGSAFPPPGAKARAVETSARVGDLERKLRVTGDRVWNKGALGEPEPFTSMPVEWRNAWGGAAVPDNPLGKGAAPDPKTGIRAAPNIYQADRVPAKPDEPVAPATYLPVGSGWPVRSQKPVTADQEWLAAGGPGLPPDFDRDWFFTAHPDQRGAGQFRAGEAFAVSGMHPTKAEVTGALPGETPWVRLEKVAGDGQGVEPVDVPLRLDTVWLFPDQEKGIVVWHGEVPALDDEASDVLAVRAGFGEPAEELVELPAEAEAPAPPPPLADAPPPPPEPAPPPVGTEEPPANLVDAENAAEPVDVPVEPVPAPPARPRTVEECEKQAAEKARARLNDAIDEVEKTFTDADIQESFAVVNDVFEAKGLPPITPEQGRQAVTEQMNRMRGVVNDLPDEELLKTMSSKEIYGDLDVEAGKKIMTDKFTAAGMPAADARALIDKAVASPGFDANAKMSDTIANQIGMDLEKAHVDRSVMDSLEGPDPNAAAKKAKANDFLQKHLNTDVDSLAAMAEANSVPPALQTSRDLEKFLGNADAAKQLEPILPLLDAKAAEGDIRQVAARAAGKVLPPEEVALRNSVLAKHLPPEEFAAYQKTLLPADPLKDPGKFDPTMKLAKPDGLAELGEKWKSDKLQKLEGWGPPAPMDGFGQLDGYAPRGDPPDELLKGMGVKVPDGGGSGPSVLPGLPQAGEPLSERPVALPNVRPPDPNAWDGETLEKLGPTAFPWPEPDGEAPDKLPPPDDIFDDAGK